MILMASARSVGWHRLAVGLGCTEAAQEPRPSRNRPPNLDL